MSAGGVGLIAEEVFAAWWLEERWRVDEGQFGVSG